MSCVVILDYGSQYTQLITRRVRELEIFSVILPGDASLDKIKSFNPQAIILSGGPASVHEAQAPKLPEGFLNFQRSEKIPLLGICYGMQLLAQALGGRVETSLLREYGRADITPKNGGHLFTEPFHAWMSHGDHISELPAGFKLTGVSEDAITAAMENEVAFIYALQFHPEVTHTENGKEILRKFLMNISKIKPDWTIGKIRDEQIGLIQKQVGPTNHVICGLSGGVDSTVAATLVQQAIGDRLHCIFVDHGMLRFQERERVLAMFEKNLHLSVTCVDASSRFLSELKGVTDPEQKRKIIGKEFISVFDQAALDLGKKLSHTPKFLVQGTLYPDVIESSSGHKHSATIKSHHNVGGLPKDLKFELIEPLRKLFKDEVRELGKTLDIPASFLMRHPFPGPGLAVRIIGEINFERLEILRQVDEIFIESLKKAQLYDQIWQAFAVFLPIKSVGVQGDGRTHDHVVALRAVTSTDGMTADWFSFEPKFLREVSLKICNQVRGVNRVVYDISSKPPATIEWE